MQWTQTAPEDVGQEPLVAEIGNVRFSIDPKPGDGLLKGKHFCCCQLVVTEWSGQPVAVIKEQWQRRAIEKARAELDRLEAELNGAEE